MITDDQYNELLKRIDNLERIIMREQGYFPSMFKHVALDPTGLMFSQDIAREYAKLVYYDSHKYSIE